MGKVDIDGKGIRMQGFMIRTGRAHELSAAYERLRERCRLRIASAHAKLLSERGQGTTEYAILVGVLVVIAIVAITVFRPKVEELWNAIADGINGL